MTAALHQIPHSSSPGLIGRSSSPEASAIEPMSRGVLDAPRMSGARERLRHASASSRRITPELCQQTRPRKSEGAGNAGCPRHPRPVCIGSKHTVVTTGTPEHPAFSCAMVLTVSFVLFPATNSFLSPSLNGLTATSPGWAGFASAQLGISNGCQNHTTSPYAATSTNASTGHVLPAKILVKALKRRSSARRSYRSRETRPATAMRASAAASTASHPASVTTRDPPLCGWDSIPACAGHDNGGAFHTRDSASSRRITPELCQQTRPRKSEGAGNAGCPRHPRPVCIGSKHTVVTTGTPEHPAFSCAMVLTVSFVLFPATNSFLSPSLNGLTATSPGWAGFASAQLGISNGCQNHTTSPYAATSTNPSTSHVLPAEVLVKALKRRSSARRSIAHGKPALRPPCAPTLPRPPHPIPRS